MLGLTGVSLLSLVSSRVVARGGSRVGRGAVVPPLLSAPPKL